MDSQDESIQWVGHCDLNKVKGLHNKADQLMLTLSGLVDYDIESIAIEEPIMRFANGRSSAHIISLLQQFNGMIQSLVRLAFGYEPILINVNTARKQAFPDLKFPKGSNRKELVRQWVYEKYPNLELPLKRTGKPKDFIYDQCDSIVLGLAHSRSLA